MSLLFILLVFISVFAGIYFFTKTKRELPLQMYIFAVIVIIGLFYSIYIELLSFAITSPPTKLPPPSYVWEEGDHVFIAEVTEASIEMMTSQELSLLVSRVSFFILMGFGTLMLYAIGAYNAPKNSKLRKQALWQITKFIFSLKG